MYSYTYAFAVLILGVILTVTILVYITYIVKINTDLTINSKAYVLRCSTYD